MHSISYNHAVYWRCETFADFVIFVPATNVTIKKELRSLQQMASKGGKG